MQPQALALKITIFGIVPTLFDKYDIHVHVPEGATLRMAAAGIAMVTSIVSMLTETPIRRDVAMTGEIPSRKCFVDRSLKEKLLAALRGNKDGHYSR